MAHYRVLVMHNVQFMGRLMQMLNSPFARRSLLIAAIVCSLHVAALAGAEARVLKDISYKPDAADDYERERCKLDLYLPPDDTPRDADGFPTIVWFHGGALQGGDKSSGEAIARRFAKEGIAVASANYRLSPKATFPAYIDDAAAAFAYVRGAIREHGGSEWRIFLSGHSAGGYLTAMVGVDPQYLAKYKLKTNQIAGLLPISGQMITHSTVRKERGISETQPLIDAAAPAYYASANTPPVLNIAGGSDLPARAEESRYFIAAMKAAGHTNATYLEVAGRDHGSIANRIPEADDIVAKTMIEFVHRAKRSQ